MYECVIYAHRYICICICVCINICICLEFEGSCSFQAFLSTSRRDLVCHWSFGFYAVVTVGKWKLSTTVAVNLEF